MSVSLLTVARSIALMAVETCSKAIFALCSRAWEKSMLFTMCFLRLVGVDCAVLVFASCGC